MRVRILGSHGGVAPGYHTSSYQLSPSLLLDAGSAASSLTPQEQAEITDILVTHPHLDHIKDIAFLIENSFSAQRAPLTLHSIPSVLEDIHKHLFNNVLWPDFSRIVVDRDTKKTLLRFSPIHESSRIHDLTFKPFPVQHPGNSTGYLVESSSSQVVFSGDTGPCESLWEVANSCQKLKAIFTEITFPSHMETLAKASGHFTLQMLLKDLKKLSIDVPIFIAHFKPQYLAELLDEFYSSSEAIGKLKLLRSGDVLSF